MKWRRYRGNLVWHFNEQCFDWPTENYVEESKEPKEGIICEICYELHKAEQRSKYGIGDDDNDVGIGYDEFEFERYYKCQ